jgi:hypothetical protein
MSTTAWKCSNSRSCTETDYRNLVVDTQSNDIICTSCGAVQPMDVNDVYNLAQRYASNYANDNTGLPSFKDSYVRFVHFVERCSAHDREDPLEVEGDDMDLIREKHVEFMEKSYFYKLRAEQGLLDKKDIQQLLRFIDGTKPRGKKWRAVAKSSKEKLKIKKEKPKPKKYSRTYLEKWNSLVNELTGKELEAYSDLEVVRVTDLLNKFSDLWDEWQPPRDKKDRNTWKYKNRKHFPNLDFAFQQVHNMLGLSKYNKHFPMPTTPAAMKKLKLYWRDMCETLVKQGKLDPSLIPLEKPLRQLALEEVVSKTSSSEGDGSSSE